VREIYERCFSRQPTHQEATAIQAKLAAAESVHDGLADLFWALLNSNEFLFNH